MARLLPSLPDTTAAEEAEPRVIGVDSDDADDLLSALSSATARKLLTALHEEVDTASGLSKRLDTTLQNVQYHLKKLEAAEIVTVIDTVYSEKGREMKVYAPADRPLVVFAGREQDSSGLRTALKRLLGAVGILAVLSAVVQALLRNGPWLPFRGNAGSYSPQSGSVHSMGVKSTEAAGHAAQSGLPPGVLFFLGGLAVLLVISVAWYLSSRT